MKILIALVVALMIAHCASDRYGHHSGSHESNESHEREGCNSTSCLNNGTCIYPRRGCNCQQNYFGSNCQYFDYCWATKPCPQKCRNISKNDTYICYCDKGYEVNATGGCSPIDYCAQNVCQNGANCTNIIERHPTYRCDCVPGFIGDNCEFKDYCYSSTGTPICQNSGRCKNLWYRGNTYDFDCKCARGWTGKNCSTPKTNRG